MPIQLSARTRSGADLVALAEQLAAELAVAAPEHDRDASYPFEGIAALQRARYFTAPVPSELGGLGVDSLHDLVVAASRLARGDASLAIGVEHAHGRPRQRRPSLAHGRRARRRPPRLRVRRDAHRGRPRGRDHRDRRQRAGPGPHPSGDHRHAHRVGLARRRGEDLLHDVAGGDRAVHDGLVRRRRGQGALRLRAHPRVLARRRGPRRLGRARHARVRQPLGDVRRGRAARVRAARRVPGRQPRGLPGVQPDGRAVPRRGVAGDRGVRVRDRHPAARRPRPRRPLADPRGGGRDRPRRRPGEPVARRPRGRRRTSTPATAPSRRSSPRSRARRRSSTRRPCASSTARSR